MVNILRKSNGQRKRMVGTPITITNLIGSVAEQLIVNSIEAVIIVKHF